MKELSNTQRNRLAFIKAVYPGLASQVEGLIETEMSGIAVGDGVSACVDELGNINFGPTLADKMKGWISA